MGLQFIDTRTGIFSSAPAVYYLIGAAMTVLFTVIVNIIALRKVKNLKLTDVA
jgi:hypothetical protein